MLSKRNAEMLHDARIILVLALRDAASKIEDWNLDRDDQPLVELDKLETVLRQSADLLAEFTRNFGGAPVTPKQRRG